MGNPNRLLENINKVYPWVKCKLDSNVDADINFDPNNQPVFKDWLGNLRVFYAIDFGDHVSIIFENDVPEYYSIDEIHKSDGYQSIKMGCKTNNPTSHCINCSYKELTPILTHLEIQN